MDDKITLMPLEIRPIGPKKSLLEQVIVALWPYLLFGIGVFAGWVLRGME